MSPPQTEADLVAKSDVSVKVLSNGKVLKVQKRRQRRILSCIYCHSKKIKCSRVLPTCNNCEKLGLTCQYFANDRISKGGKNKKRNSRDESDMVSATSDGSNGNKDLTDGASDENGVGGANGSSIDHGMMINDDGAHTGIGLENLSSNFPNLPKSLLQTPVMNNLSHNITNSYFSNNNGTAASAAHDTASTSSQADNKEEYSFNLSSFTFANYPTSSYKLASGSSPSQTQNLLGRTFNDHILGNLNAVRPSQPPPAQTASQTHTQSQPQQPEPHAAVNSALISRTNSGTNISSLFAKNPSHLYPTGPNGAAIGNFVDSRPASTSNFQTDQPVSSHYLNSSSFELSHNFDNTKNFLNGTNTYYDNENLLEDLEDHLPTSKEKSYELVERYLNSVHLLLPIITNIDDFVSEHDKYWNECNPFDKDSNNSLTDFNFLQFYTLYFPILYAATISEFEEYDNLLLNQDINKYLKGFNKICQYYNYPHGLKIIPLLLGNVIIQSTSPNPSTMEMSQIVRYAKFLQMNKDPVLSLKIKNPEIVKFRRLLWWTIFGLDCLTSHNFCLPPICKFEDFNVQLPSEEEPIINDAGEVVDTQLSVSTLSLNIKFKFDRILNELVSQLHNESTKTISHAKINEIKDMITEFFEFIHLSINKMNLYHKKYPPKSMNEMNFVNFIKNHSWSFVDRALMLLHKKFLLSEDLPNGEQQLRMHILGQNRNDNSDLSIRNERSNSDASQSIESTYSVHLTKPRNGLLSFNQFEDTFQPLAESNLIKNITNFQALNINLNPDLNKYSHFSYEDFNNNLIPAILHNLNDFLKYNDFLKFGKFNWYVKRTIPLDSIILLFIIMIVKFKFEMMKFNELIIYVKLINKSLFILNRKWFKNEKYKRMLSLTNLTWEFILKKFRILQLITKFTNTNFSISNSTKSKFFNKYQYFNHQLTGYLNTAEIFKTMKVAQPALSMDLINKLNNQRLKNIPASPESPHLEMAPLTGFDDHAFFIGDSPKPKVHFDLDDEIMTSSVSKYSDSTINLVESTEVVEINNDFNVDFKILSEFPVNDLDTNELVVLQEKIAFDLKNNYVDINDYCAFYISLENILHELINYID